MLALEPEVVGQRRVRKRQPSKPRRRLIVPLVLAVATAGAAAALSLGTGCDDDEPRLDAGVGDGGVDTPIV